MFWPGFRPAPPVRAGGRSPTEHVPEAREVVGPEYGLAAGIGPADVRCRAGDLLQQWQVLAEHPPTRNILAPAGGVLSEDLRGVPIQVLGQAADYGLQV